MRFSPGWGLQSRDHLFGLSVVVYPVVEDGTQTQSTKFFNQFHGSKDGILCGSVRSECKLVKAQTGWDVVHDVLENLFFKALHQKMCDLEDISYHIYDRISSLQQMLDLSEWPQNRIMKLKQELFALEKLLEEFERHVGQQKEKLRHLKEFEESFQTDFEDVKHIKDNIPAHMPRKKGPTNGSEFANNQNEAVDVHPAQLENARKTNKSLVREMEFITMPEFETIPQYMKGLVSYDQLNSAVQSINTAVTAKYKILHQSMKTLNNHTRKLQQRFKDQETKDTKGQYFVVEDDIREFSQIKVDKRFQRILTMLRHCQRLRELRGGGLTRYMLL